MKLSEAQDYQCRILDLTEQLNYAINEATNDGVVVEMEIISVGTLNGDIPFIQTEVFINPRDIDQL